MFLGTKKGHPYAKFTFQRAADPSALFKSEMPARAFRSYAASAKMGTLLYIGSGFSVGLRGKASER